MAYVKTTDSKSSLTGDDLLRKKAKGGTTSYDIYTEYMHFKGYSSIAEMFSKLGGKYKVAPLAVEYHILTRKSKRNEKIKVAKLSRQ